MFLAGLETEVEGWRRGGGFKARDPWSEREPEHVPFDTLYLGGGTPSALRANELKRLLDNVSRLGLTRDPWIGLEANPEDVSDASLAVWRELGIQFLSLGVQAFDDDALKRLGRRHRGGEAERAVELALAAGFSTVSVDLMYALPEESNDEWASTLACAIRFSPDHLSCYELTFHDGTPFGTARERGQLLPLAEEGRAERFEFTHQFLESAGYEGYEVSNFARTPSARSQHNPKYWFHTPYLGLGPSAHSWNGYRRWWNWRSLETWRKHLEDGSGAVEEFEEPDRGALLLEHLLLGLRLKAGIDLEITRSWLGVDLAAEAVAVLDEALRNGLLTVRGSQLVPTLAGRALSESLAVELARAVFP